MKALAEATGQELVTKSDLKEAMADPKVDILRWLVVTHLTLGGLLFAALKLVK